MSESRALVDALRDARERCFEELRVMLKDDDHPATIQAKTLTLGIVEAAWFIAEALQKTPPEPTSASKLNPFIPRNPSDARRRDP